MSVHRAVLFFFLIIRHPPRSTLFPSTTLFRSVEEAGLELRQRANQVAPHRQRVAHPAVVVGDDLLDRAVAVEVLHVHREDRKSTRLNSSHANISYAVFCLKKKKTT